MAQSLRRNRLNGTANASASAATAKSRRKGGKKLPSSELPLPQTSTLRSRRRLANLLVFAAGIFVCCWTPHVVCFLGVELSGESGGSTPVCTPIVFEFTLLLGECSAMLLTNCDRRPGIYCNCRAPG